MRAFYAGGRSVSFKAGFAHRDVTPPHGVELFGGAAHTGEGCGSGLAVHTVYLTDGSSSSFIVSFDLIWVSRQLTDAVRTRLGELCDIGADSILVVGTHAHGTPQICEHVQGAGQVDSEYVLTLCAAACDAAQEAQAKALACDMSLLIASTDAAVYRRKRILDLQALKRGRIRMTWANRPAPEVDIDNTTASVVFTSSESGRKLGAICSAACHPTVYGAGGLCADYPASMRKTVQARLALEHEPVFLLGCCGDVRPNLTVSPGFSLRHPIQGAYRVLFDPVLFRKDNGRTEIEAFGKRLAEDCTGGAIEPVAPAVFKCAQRTVSLPVHDDAPAVAFRIQAIRLGEALVVVAMEGEILNRYASLLRTAGSKRGVTVVPVSCANGMVGYIPDARTIREGGYEVERSLPLFGLQKRFSSEIEQVIVKSASDLLKQVLTP